MFSTPSGPDTTRTVKTPDIVTVGALLVDPRGQKTLAGHAVGEAAPSGQKLSTGHTFCVALPDPLLHQNPAAHGRHEALLVAPEVEYLPAGQAFCVALVEALPHQCPALHWPLQAAVPRPVMEPNVPAGQEVHSVAAPVENFPAGQVLGLYAPVGQ
jgi:hypothetical protein